MPRARAGAMELDLADFPSGSDGKASAYNAGDLGLIPGPVRSPGEGNGNPLQCSCLENPWDGEAWWAAVYGVAQSRTRLKRLSSSSSSSSKTFSWFETQKVQEFTVQSSLPHSLTTQFSCSKGNLCFSILVYSLLPYS